MKIKGKTSFGYWCFEASSFSKIRVVGAYQRQRICGLFSRGSKIKERRKRRYEELSGDRRSS